MMNNVVINREEMMTTLWFAMAFIGGLFLGGYAYVKLFGWL